MSDNQVTIDIELPTSLRLPGPPNYITSVDGKLTLDVADLSDEVLRDIGEQWAEALVEHATRRRKAPALGEAQERANP